MKPSTLRPRKVWFLLTILCLLVSSVARADKDVSKENARPIPQWLRSGVLYEVFPRDFSGKGDLNGVTARLDELKNLGVTILWIMPIHPIGEKMRKGTYGSPYAVRDYYAVNPDYGTIDDFKRLVSEAHKRNMKVILDLVVNHTAWDNVLITQHPEFYKKDAKGNIIPPVRDWSDVAGLNYANPALREYIITMMKYWINECDIDGYRCDVASMVPTDFWEQARKELEKVKPDIMMLAEADKPDLLVQAFDSDYSWPLLGTINDVIMHNKPASALEMTWENSRGRFPKGSVHMRITDDHDEARAVARYGVEGALAGSALMFTLDGVPLLYNGMEVGDATESGDPALFEKLPIFWHPKGRPPMREIYQGLTRLRKQYAAFCNTDVDWLHNSDEADLLTFTRSDGKDEFLVLINFSSRPVNGSVDIKNGEDFQPVRISGMPPTPSANFSHFRLNGYDWRIYHRAVSQPAKN
ncbi:MAG TPA: alpha-amylase family glycosyl hydrolase [Verrucomicrobiae bacterium]|nr:alpha-amylase family glycosyl hydrolase [Verrucomicrobiae bacterium]